MTINERIMFLIKDLGYNKNSFSKISGQMSSAVIENTVGKRQTKPGYEVLSKIMQTFPEINADWLLTGIGKVYKIDVSKVDLVKFRKDFKLLYSKQYYIINPNTSEEHKDLKQTIEILKDKLSSREKQLEDKERTIQALLKLQETLEKKNR